MWRTHERGSAILWCSFWHWCCWHATFRMRHYGELYSASREKTGRKLVSVSISISLDGVYFCLLDANMLRNSGHVDLTCVSNITFQRSILRIEQMCSACIDGKRFWIPIWWRVHGRKRKTIESWSLWINMEPRNGLWLHKICQGELESNVEKGEVLSMVGIFTQQGVTGCRVWKLKQFQMLHMFDLQGFADVQTLVGTGGTIIWIRV